ncbi:endonuclease domain-containing protein [Armatimonas sp.]|uniref:endonuclease domain-containing protein n=1 Tax=Armatimonas sp. TaxID=1872638 RepID=UPI00286CDB81|nr:endonuclease domain-containing protein [Armatimonas sp.]
MVPTARYRYRHVTQELVTRARQLRRESTPAEQVLWEALRGSQLQGARFRRQHPVETFILDFYCPRHKLVIEIDGGIHSQPEVRERDEERQHWIEAHGYEFLRFTNEEVLHELSWVLASIRAKIS